MGLFRDDPEHPAPASPGGSVGSAPRALGGSLLSALSRLPQGMLPSLETLVNLLVDFPAAVEPLERLIDEVTDDDPISACRTALDFVAAFFPDEDLPEEDP